MLRGLDNVSIDKAELTTMRGLDVMQESLFTVTKLDDYVPAHHPLRKVKRLVDEALVKLN